MGRCYSFAGSVTTPNDAAKPVGTIIGGTAVRPKLYDILMASSATPADHAGQFIIKRCSTTGTAGSTPTANPLDPSDPAATSTLGLAVFSAGPTLGVALLQFALNQRNWYRWVASPGRECVAPATASNGFAAMNPSVDATFTLDFTLLFEE